MHFWSQFQLISFLSSLWWRLSHATNAKVDAYFWIQDKHTAIDDQLSPWFTTIMTANNQTEYFAGVFHIFFSFFSLVENFYMNKLFLESWTTRSPSSSTFRVRVRCCCFHFSSSFFRLLYLWIRLATVRFHSMQGRCFRWMKWIRPKKKTLGSLDICTLLFCSGRNNNVRNA